MGETIKIPDVPDERKEFLVAYKEHMGLNWQGMARKLEEFIREYEDFDESDYK